MPEGENPQDGGEKPSSITPVVPKEGEKPPEKPKVEAKPEAKPEPKPEPKNESPKAVKIGEEDELPENAELLELSKQALNKRLMRHTKKELRDRFGTDDFDKIKADLDELSDLRSKEEDRRRAALSEQERLKEDRDREKKRADDAERKLRDTVDSQTFAEYDRTAENVLAEHIDPEAMELAVVKLKKHVLSLDDDELKNPKKLFGDWAKEFAKKNPKFAKTVEQPPEPKKIPLQTGANINAKKDKGDPELANKTAKPGQVNSMSKAEYAEYKRQRGLG